MDGIYCLMFFNKSDMFLLIHIKLTNWIFLCVQIPFKS